MVRSGRGRALQFGILGAAAVALLGLFLWRETGETTPVATPVVQASGAPGLQGGPVSEQAKSEWVLPEAPAKAADTDRDSVRKQAPAARAGDPTTRNEDGEGSYPGDRVDDATIIALHGNKPLTADHPHVAAAIKIQERNTDWLMAHPTVVGTAVGLNDKGEIALLVMTKVAGATDIPGVIEGLPVVLWQSGEIFSRNRIPKQESFPLQGDLSPRNHYGGKLIQKYDWPVPIGVSTGLTSADTPGYIMAGTLGARVKRGTEVFALSNNHVYADEHPAPAALTGALIVQPGTLDQADHGSAITSGAGGEVIGTLSTFVPILTNGSNNLVDAAIAASTTDQLGNQPPAKNWTPKSAPVGAALKMSVKKVGRTTGETSGTVKGINSTVNVNYGTTEAPVIAKFVNQIVIGNATFSAGGDSGSLIVKKTGNDPVGLLFAGSSSTTIANRIGDVLSALNVTVDGTP